MNVREDEISYQFGLKIILVLCVPVLQVQLNNYKHDIRNSKKNFHH